MVECQPFWLQFHCDLKFSAEQLNLWKQKEVNGKYKLLVLIISIVIHNYIEL